jgi:phage FluMu gp28-like protein
MTAKALKTAARRIRKAAPAVAVAAAMAAGTVMPPVAAAGSGSPTAGLVSFRKYQQKVFWDHTTKTLLIHWSRQIGKSYTLAGWAVDRLLRYPGRLVTVLSNSRANGLEFVLKCQEVCRKLGQAIELETNHAALDARTDLSEDMKFDMMRGEVRITLNGQTGRILVLAANPRTARGFSGDLILDEFAFHEDSRAIWEAAEPIISSNPDFLCRISSTGNGKRNMFYQLISEGRVPYYRVRRSDAWAAGEIKIYSAISGKEITPDAGPCRIERQARLRSELRVRLQR